MHSMLKKITALMMLTVMLSGTFSMPLEAAKGKAGWVAGDYGTKYYYNSKGKWVKDKTVYGKNGDYYQTNSVYGVGLSLQELSKLKTKVKAITKKIIKPKMNDYQKVTAINDYIVKTVSYAPHWSYKKANTAYGALINKTAQCSGYARAFKALCDYSKIPCYYIHADDADHQWNVVKVGGKWYHMDTQGNDLSRGKILFLAKSGAAKSGKKTKHPTVSSSSYITGHREIAEASLEKAYKKVAAKYKGEFIYQKTPVPETYMGLRMDATCSISAMYDDGTITEYLMDSLAYIQKDAKKYAASPIYLTFAHSYSKKNKTYTIQIELSYEKSKSS